MGILDGAIGYLSGAMEYAADHGIGWRRKIIKLAHDAGLDVFLIDPTDKPIQGDGLSEEKHKLQQMISNHRYAEAQQYVKTYRHFDLRFTDLSDFLIAMINPEIPQWGTSNEIYLSESQKKPIFFICPGGLSRIPTWLYAVMPKIKSDDPVQAAREARVYQTVEEVVEELVNIDQGKIPLTSDWVLIRKEIERRNKLRMNLNNL